jgi:transcriptional repressor NrdR
MRCPYCSSLENKVIDSRLGKDGNVTRRRRECIACKKRFTTYEKIEESLPVVIKKDGRRESFNEDKIKRGIATACEKRPISADSLYKVVERVIYLIQNQGKKEIRSSFIGEKVMEDLFHLDEVAYVRFASVYRRFKDVNEFMHEVIEYQESKKEILSKDQKVKQLSLWNE